jgi:hypothetical protein
MFHRARTRWSGPYGSVQVAPGAVAARRNLVFPVSGRNYGFHHPPSRTNHLAAPKTRGDQTGRCLVGLLRNVKGEIPPPRSPPARLPVSSRSRGHSQMPVSGPWRCIRRFFARRLCAPPPTHIGQHRRCCRSADKSRALHGSASRAGMELSSKSPRSGAQRRLPRSHTHAKGRPERRPFRILLRPAQLPVALSMLIDTPGPIVELIETFCM